MMKSYKVMLHPTQEQTEMLFKSAGACRWAYNHTLAKQQENREKGGKFIKDGDIRKEITQIKKTEEYAWLNEVSAGVPAQAVKDACEAYKSFFKGIAKFPKFKSRNKSKPSFYNDPTKLYANDDFVFIEKVGRVKLAQTDRIPKKAGREDKSIKYYNPRITFDGINWWIALSIEIEDMSRTPKGEGVGIDVGVKDLAITSEGKVYGNINKTETVKKLHKKLKRLQRQVSRKYEANKQGLKYVKTKNIEKLELEIKKLHQRIVNIRKNYMHHVVNDILSTDPAFVAMEDLNITGMMKNRHLSKAVAEQALYDFKRIVEYKSKNNCTQFINADRFYPSSKTCNSCGEVNKELRLKDRVFTCPTCGYTKDRDMNAADNLKTYGERQIAINEVALTS